jgi:ankyrin repeat protein
MRLKLLSIAAVIIFPYAVPARAQQSVCELFKDLESHDGAQVVVRGELFLDGEQAALGATECETRYQSRLAGNFRAFFIWPAAIELGPSEKVPKNQLLELKNRAAEIKKLDADGQTVVAYGTFSGRLTLQKDSSMPARLVFDAARDITVEALPEASKLPVIPICDLFQNLAAYKDQRIAVRAEIVGTTEGVWLSGRCKSNFVTDGHRWPLLLTYGAPDYFGADPAALFREDQRKIHLPESKDRESVSTTATFVGRLRMRDKYVGMCRPGGQYIWNGFGHLSAAAAELIVESAFDAAIGPRLARAEDSELEAPCEPPNHAELCASSVTLVQAARNNCADRVRALLAANGIDSGDEGPSPALSAAIRNGDAEVAMLLINAGAPVNPVTTADWSQPLVLAAQWNRITILEALVKAGADVNRKDRDGNTLLLNQWVFTTGVGETLLDAGADPNIPDGHGTTPLMYASQFGYGDEVKLLLEHHADPNLKDNGGRTALMYAAEGEYADAMPLLLAAGADPNWRDLDGHTALDVAKESGKATAVELLEKAMDGHR